MRHARWLLAAVLVAPAAAHASFLSGDALDTFANVLSWVVLIIVPLGAIGAFFYVHVLPELIAEKRQHPHKDSIKVLCILSLFFGGLLWPFAWLWAYTRPIGYRAIYGTEKHHDYFLEMGEKLRAGHLSEAEIEHLHVEVSSMSARGVLPQDLRKLQAELDARAAGTPVPVPEPAPERSRQVAAVEGGGE